MARYFPHLALYYMHWDNNNKLTTFSKKLDLYIGQLIWYNTSWQGVLVIKKQEFTLIARGFTVGYLIVNALIFILLPRSYSEPFSAIGIIILAILFCAVQLIED